MRVGIRQLQARGTVGRINAAHVAAVVERCTERHGSVRPLEREASARSRRAGGAAQRGGPDRARKVILRALDDLIGVDQVGRVALAVKVPKAPSGKTV